MGLREALRAAAAAHPERRLQLWFQDEARIGRKRYERTLLPDSVSVTEIARGFTGHGGCGGR